VKKKWQELLLGPWEKHLTGFLGNLLLTFQYESNKAKKKKNNKPLRLPKYFLIFATCG